MPDSKMSFDDALERLGDGFPVKARDVSARALRRFVWIAEWHIPGCLSESSSVCLTKASAIESCLSMAEGEDGQPPRGMATALRSSHRFDGHSPLYGDVISTIDRVRLSDIL